MEKKGYKIEILMTALNPHIIKSYDFVYSYMAL